MKAVLYHADANFAKQFSKGLYKHLITELKSNLNKFNIELIHITAKNFDGWGDINYYYDVEDVNEVIYNREKSLLQFLENDAVDSEVYWFLEPDFRLINLFPPLTTDICLLLRDDAVAITPAWRLAKKTALPVFQEAFENFDLDHKEWDGDSISWLNVYKNMGAPREPGFYNYKNISIELRPYSWYATRHKARYSAQYKGASKMQIVTNEYRDWLEQENK